MSTISASTASNTAFKVTSDTTGTLVFQTGAVPTTAISIDASQVVSIGNIAVTGATTFAAGSAAAPSITTTGDTNTGIFFPAANTIAASTDGTERLRLDSSGNLGIGTNSPAFRLHVSGSSSQFALISTTDTTSTTGVLFGDSASNTVGRIEYVHSTNGMAFFTNGTTQATLDSSGNLGLGVTPSAWATLVPAFQLGGGGTFLAARSTTPEMYLGTNAHYDGTNWKYKTSAVASLYAQDTSEHKWYIAPSGTAGNTVTFTQAMTLNTSGNLGIGTSSPAYKLDVERSGDGITAGIAGGTYGIRFDNGGTFSSGMSTIHGVDSTLTGSYQPIMLNGATVRFGISGTEVARFDSSGNLLVGTTSNTNGSRLIVRGGGTYNNTFTQTNSTIQIISDEMSVNQWYPTFNITMVRQSLTTGNGGFGGIGFTTVDDSNNNGMDDAGRIAIVNENGGAVASGTAMAFYTQVGSGTRTNPATERARFTSVGAFLVGGTTGIYNAAGSINSVVSTVNDFCFAGANSNSTNPRGLYLRNTNTTAGDYAIYFEASAAVKFYVTGNGVIHSTNTSVQSVSDARHKENVRDLDKGLTEVLALKPRRFDWKEGKGTGAKDVAGFIAQEVETVLPELVGEWKETLDATEHYKSIAMTNVIPMLVKAIQELTARLAALESK